MITLSLNQTKTLDQLCMAYFEYVLLNMPDRINFELKGWEHSDWWNDVFLFKAANYSPNSDFDFIDWLDYPADDYFKTHKDIYTTLIYISAYYQTIYGATFDISDLSSEKLLYHYAYAYLSQNLEEFIQIIKTKHAYLFYNTVYDV